MTDFTCNASRCAENTKLHGDHFCNGDLYEMWIVTKSLLLHNELDWNNGWKQLKSRQHISAFFLILDRLDFWLHTLKEFLYYCYDEESCCWTVLKLTLNSQVKPQKVWNSQKLGGGARGGKRMFLMYNILLQQIQNCKIWYNLELNNWTIW